MIRTWLCCISLFAILCFSLICLSPTQALNCQPPEGSAAQLERSTRLPGLAGHWILQTTGDAIDIDESDGKLTARIGGIEWELVPAGQELAATRTLSGDEARRLFPDIGDAPLLLAGKSVNLLLTVGSGGTSLEMSMSIIVPRTGRRVLRDMNLMSGSLTRQPIVAGVDPTGGTRSATVEIVPQVMGTPTMAVFPSPAPNAFGSPSFATYTANVFAALNSGLSAVGNPTQTPTAYFRVSSLDDRGNIVTGFPSWKGLISPATNFGAAFSSELGNRIHFGLHILGNGTEFRLSNLQFHMHGSDAGDLFAFDGDFVGLSYSATRVGINYGPDHTRGTMDDVIITSGPTTQLVDELIYVGVGNALAPDDVSCPGTNQATLDCIKSVYDSKIPFKIATTYNLFDDSSQLLATGSGTVDFGNCVSLSACPGNIVTRTPFGQMSTAVSYVNPVGSSSCSESTQVSCIPASGSQFPVGATTVTCTATDEAGNKASCSLTVAVWDVGLQDNSSGDVLLINSKTGDYSYTRCGPGGLTLTGKGSLQRVNGVLMLSDIQATRKVMASFFTNQLTGHATIMLIPAQGISQTFTISSTNPNPSITCPH